MGAATDGFCFGFLPGPLLWTTVGSKFQRALLIVPASQAGLIYNVDAFQFHTTRSFISFSSLEVMTHVENSIEPTSKSRNKGNANRQAGREGSIRAPIHVQSGIIFSDSWTMIMQSVWPFNLCTLAALLPGLKGSIVPINCLRRINDPILLLTTSNALAVLGTTLMPHETFMLKNA